MIYIQSYFLYENNMYADCSGDKIKKENFIELAKYSNYFLNKTGKEVNFWGNLEGINFVKSLGLNYNRYYEIPKKYEKEIIISNYFGLNKLAVASLQTEDFYMVDLDFFLLDEEKIPKIEEKTFYVSHEEWHGIDFLEGWINIMVKSFEKENPKLHKIITNKTKNNPAMYNFGIFGGKGSELNYLYEMIFNFAIKFLRGKYQNRYDESAAMITLEQLVIPIFLKELGFKIKTIYSSNDKFKKNFNKFNELSFDIGMAHFIDQSKNDANFLNQLKL